MKKPELSKHYQERLPSVIRKAQIAFSDRVDKDLITVINLSIGNVSLPMYPALKKRMIELGNTRLSDGVVKYTSTVGTLDARKAFLNILDASGLETSDLFVNITDGGSSSMELMLLGVNGPSSKKPIMLLDPAYTNYVEFAKRLSIPVITSRRKINSDGSFKKIDFDKLVTIIKKNSPTALVVIPYDNPTGQFLPQDTLEEIARICVKHGLWLVSDEAYRPLYYVDGVVSSIWNISEENVPGIRGIRIGIESASKVWNACGLRIGGIITDNKDFHSRSVNEYTANLCANALGQEIFGALADEPHENINRWFEKQKKYYKSNLQYICDHLEKEIPGLIVTKPEAAIYCIVDFKNICDNGFDAEDFVHYCATKGKVKIGEIYYTLLLAPMNGFYANPIEGKTQLRISMVETEDLLRKTPLILSKLYNNYLLL